MDQPDLEAEPNFTRPLRQVLTMAIVLALTATGVALVFPQVAPTFLANPYLNSFIFAVFVVGVIVCFWQMFQLWRSVNWIKGFASGRLRDGGAKAPRLLGPMAALLKSRSARMQISSTASRTILDSVATRIDELRDITRYIVNLLVFLGLLGTFYGLATTVPAIVDTISNLEPRDGETGADVFRRLQSGLEAQMGGMGVAFASSLLGLAGSLVVGLLELFAGHGQNRFYRELEEWLSTITRIGFASGDGESASDQSAIFAVLSTMSEHIESMQTLFTRSDVNRAMLDERLGSVVEALESLTAQMQDPAQHTGALERIADSQVQLAKALETQNGGSDAESRMRLRSIDVQLLRILEEMAAGRQESTSELRTEIETLTKAVRQMTNAQINGRSG
jgi:hypothetical protein